MSVQREKECSRRLLLFTKKACLRKKVLFHTGEKYEICLSPWESGLEKEEKLTVYKRKEEVFLGQELLKEDHPLYFRTSRQETLIVILCRREEEIGRSTCVELSADQIYKIGDAHRNEIYYQCFTFVKKEHACIFKEGREYVLWPTGEGIYVNQTSIGEKTTLKKGDVIDVYGLHILFLEKILICLSYEGVFRTARQADDKPKGTLRESSRKPSAAGEEEWVERGQEEEGLPLQGEVEILLPEPEGREQKQSLLLNIGPSFAMLLPMVMMTLMTKKMGYGGQFYLMSFMMSITSAGMMLLMAGFSFWYQKRLFGREIQEKRAQYLQYLDQKREELLNRETECRQLLLKKYCSAEELMQREKGSYQVRWNRHAGQADFLSFRLGVGRRKFPFEIKLSGEQKSIVKNPLVEEAKQLKERFQFMEQVPALVDLKETGQVAFLLNETGKGQWEAVIQLLIQIAACACYTEVKVVCFYQKQAAWQEKIVECIRWLPHSWSGDRQMRYLAGDEGEAAAIIPDLSRLLENSRGNRENGTPWYLFFLLNEELIRGEQLHGQITECAGEYPVSTIFAVSENAAVPVNCACLVKEKEICLKKGNGYQIMEAQLERVEAGKAESYARGISGCLVRENAIRKNMPEQVTFLQMYGCELVEELDCRARWRQGRPEVRMKVPIGIGQGEESCFLDVHEKFHGPHGLIAGTTGSGKSELLQTYLMSLAVNFGPEEINFFMIDYKGGGTGNMLMELPHCAGVVSNLSGRQMARAMSAIKSENKRRQALLAKYQVNHINAYMEQYRLKADREPMPHLLLVIDEFAELKKEEPEFMQEIISLSQVGRSLGVHLILATQKPAGTVDDRIWSNARFRLCLRVQDKQDSMDVLHSADAAFLTNPGQCCFQIGGGTFYELFQAGYLGEAYSGRKKGEPRVFLLDHTGKRISLHEEKEKGRETQLEAVLRYIGRIAEEEGKKRAKKLWMPELPEKINLTELPEEKKKGQELFLGKYDDPENQKQGILTYDPQRQGHLSLCGGSATGKTTFLALLLLQISMGRDPREEQILLVDRGKELAAFRKMPGCIGYLAHKKNDDSFFHQLKKLVAKKRNAREKGLKMPRHFLCIDNFGGFFGRLKEEQQEFLIQLAGEGPGIKITFLITAASVSEMPGKLYEKIRTTLSFEMNDCFSYGDIMRQYHIPVLPRENTPGRGLCRVENRILEFQAALVQESRAMGKGSEVVEEAAQREIIYWKEKGIDLPPRFRTVPEKVTYQGLCQDYEWRENCIPLGYDLQNGRIADLILESGQVFLISGAGVRQKKMLLVQLAESVTRAGYQSMFLKQGEGGKQTERILLAKPEEKLVLLAEDIREAILFSEAWSAERKEGERPFVIAVVERTQELELSGNQWFWQVCSRQRGLHIGGNAAQQRIFSFEDLGYTRLSGREPDGIAYLKQGTENSTVIIEMPKEEVEDDID